MAARAKKQCPACTPFVQASMARPHMNETGLAVAMVRAAARMASD